MPSSPIGPCRRGKTTTVSSAVAGTTAVSWLIAGPTADSASGRAAAPRSMAARASSAWTQSPSRVMPTGSSR